MTWFATSANEQEAAKDRYAPFLAVDFDFPSGHYRFWTGSGEITLNGDTYLGAGELASIDGEPESAELGLQRMRFGLSGVDPSLVDESDIDNSFGRPVLVYLGFLNPETMQIIAAPETLWEGRIDSFRRIDGPQPLIEVTAEHRLALLDRIDGWRYTHEHQQVFYPSANDKGFDQVTAIMLKKVIWSGKEVDPAVRRPGNPPPRDPRPRQHPV